MALSILATTTVLGLLTGGQVVAEAAQPTLAWQACADMVGFECAFLTVPRDWNDPTKGDIQVAMARHRSTGSSDQRIGSLFFNPGGPGGAGVASIAQAYAYLPETIKAQFDFVSWDPRGIGLTEPLQDCASPDWGAPPATGPVDWDAIEDQVRALVREANEECVAKNPGIAPYMGTMQVVRDLDAMRAAVGDQQLNYWAWSYGTRIGYTYALTFPDRFRAIILDGSATPYGSTAVFAEGYGTAADPAVNMLFQTQAGSEAAYRRSMDYLTRQALRLNASHSLTQWNVKRALEAYIEFESIYPTLARYLNDVETAIYGDGKAQRNAKRRLLRMPGPSQLVVTGAPAFVECLDYADRPNPAEQDAIAAQARQVAPITGWYRGLLFAYACEGFTPTPEPVPTSFGIDWTARLLLLGATFDSQTPYKWTVAMSSAFKASRVVTYVGGQHVTFGQAGSRCVNGYATRYLTTLALPAVDVSCPNAVPTGS